MKDGIKKLKEREISAFCMEVSMLLNAGMPLEQGMLAILAEEKTEEGKSLVKKIYSSLEEGSSFSQAMGNTGAFPKYVEDMTLMGEKTGNLEIIFRELHDFYDEKEELLESIKSAVTYPFIMIVMMFAVLIILVVKILPVFSGIYEQLGSGIPAMAVVIMDAGRIVGVIAAVLLGIVILLGVISFVYSKINGGNKLFDFEKYFMSSTATGIMIGKSRFASVLSMSFSSGIDVEYAMDLAASFVENKDLKSKIMTCKTEVSNGQSISDAIDKARIFDGIEMGILNMGLKSGNSEAALKTVSDRYSKQSRLKISNMVSAVEPALVISLSVMVGVILLTVIMPLLGIMSALG